MFDAYLTSEDLAIAKRRATEYANRYGNAHHTDDFTRDKWFVGECGEIAVEHLLDHWGIGYEKMPVGWPYDFDVGGAHLEVATHDKDHRKKYIVRKPDKVERNNDRVDLYVGVCRVSQDHYRVYGCCTAAEMEVAPLMEFRPDRPPMRAVEKWASTTALIIQLREVA